MTYFQQAIESGSIKDLKLSTSSRHEFLEVVLGLNIEKGETIIGGIIVSVKLQYGPTKAKLVGGLVGWLIGGLQNKYLPIELGLEL